MLVVSRVLDTLGNDKDRCCGCCLETVVAGDNEKWRHKVRLSASKKPETQKVALTRDTWKEILLNAKKGENNW